MPSLSEQQAIADALDGVDEAIEQGGMETEYAKITKSVRRGRAAHGARAGILLTLEHMQNMYHVQITPKESKPPHRRIEWEYDLTSEQLDQRFLAPYRRANSIVIRGRIISMDDLYRIRVYETEERIGHLANKPTDKMADVTNEFIIGPPGYELDESNATSQQSRSTTSMRVFIQSQ